MLMWLRSFGLMMMWLVVVGKLSPLIAADAPGPLPPLGEVDAQPLAANVKRVIEALQSLGSPLPDEEVERLQTAAKDRDARQLQKLIDPRVLLLAHINPESRVKVRRGPAAAELQQFGFTPVLIKVLNESTVTKRMRLVSPQAGAVYAGASKGSLQRQQQTELNNNENVKRDTDRFLAVEMFDQPPMTERLSGLEVEYAIGLILSTESGQREATIGIDLEHGAQDLGARGEVPVLFRVQPAIPVKLKIRDVDGTPTTAVLIVKDRAGRVFPPQPKRLAPDFFFQPQVYRADGESILLPPGEFSMQFARGPEYWVREKRIKVAVSLREASLGSRGEPGTLKLDLERWVNPREFGFYSGDHHIHAAGCAHYTVPTEGVTPEDMFRQVKGEGLNVGCVLTWGPCYRFQRQFFQPQPHPISEPLTLLKYDLEISGFGSQALGHVCLLNLRDQTYPGSEGTETKGWPTWTTPVMRWAKEQGGVTGYAHSASGLWIDPPAAAKRFLLKCDRDQDGVLSADEVSDALLPEPFAKIDADGDLKLTERELTLCHDRAADQLPNLAIPEMNGVGAMELPVTVVEGVCDFISAMDTRRIQEWNTWYHVLNCGFPLKVSGETDFPCMSSTHVGQGRVYVQLGNVEKLDFAAWCEGIARGRSYVSDGFAHAFDFRVNDARPGFDDVALSQPGEVTITAKVAFAPVTPETVAQGVVEPVGGKRLVGDTVELHGPRSDKSVAGGERLVEIVVNGRAVASQKVFADGTISYLKFQIPIDRSSWVALRHFPQLHTNPVNVHVSGKPIRASRESARWCEEVIDLLWRHREKAIAEPERVEAKRTFDKAKSAYHRIAGECPKD
ncbi:MAG TPA: CehA/McbA family metallohydrolase [Planctomycetaceae bacterium]|nr:CehA/McbA family metallohydrolase [Planctomycetaceae bacterium]